MLETSRTKTCSSPLNGSGSLLERKRLQLGFLPPPTSELVVSPNHRGAGFHNSQIMLGDEIETPPYNPLSLDTDPTEECTDQFSPSVFSLGQPERLLSRFEEGDDPSLSFTFSSSDDKQQLVEFCEQVYVHFYSTDSPPTTSVSERLNRQVGRVKSFDGRSDCERGVLFDDCIDLYLEKMSSKRYVDIIDDDDDEMDRDILFSCEEEFGHRRPQRRSRPRFYAADESTFMKWSSPPATTVDNKDEGGGSLLWMMENTPCDCDLLLVG